MRDLAQQIATYLQANLAGLTQTTNLFIDTMPNKPDNCVLVRNTGGLPPSTYLPLKDPTIQIVVRNTSEQAGFTIINNIYNLLHQKKGIELATGQNWVYLCNAMQEPTVIGQDDARRTEFSVNFHLKIR
jgi:hypothetical protein